MTTRTLYLHIGMGRCGSSAIQTFAQSNRETLAELGVALPASDLDTGLAVKHSGNATGLAMALRKHPDKAPEAAAIAAKVAGHVQSLTAPNCMLSSEFLYSLHAAHFAELKRAFNEAGFQVVVICYVREQREWMMSRYGQAVKSRKWTNPLEKYLLEAFRTPSLRYGSYLRPLREIFGSDNFRIRIFERHRMVGNDVRKDFCDAIGLPAARMSFLADNANASGNLLQIETMRAMNGVPDGAHFKFNNRDFLRITHGLFVSGKMAAPEGMHRLVRPRVMKKIGAYFAAENESFRAEFFPSVEAPLFSSQIPDQYDMIGPRDHATVDAVILYNEYVNRMLRRQTARNPSAAGGLGRDTAPSEASKPDHALAG